MDIQITMWKSKKFLLSDEDMKSVSNMGKVKLTRVENLMNDLINFRKQIIKLIAELNKDHPKIKIGDKDVFNDRERDINRKE